jgi:hypothetical protein
MPGFWGNIVVATESFLGMLLLALVPSLVFTKMSLPADRMRWTSHAILNLQHLQQHQQQQQRLGGSAGTRSEATLSLRVANMGTEHLYDVEFRAFLVRRVVTTSTSKKGRNGSINRERNFHFETTELALYVLLCFFNCGRGRKVDIFGQVSEK